MALGLWVGGFEVYHFRLGFKASRKAAQWAQRYVDIPKEMMSARVRVQPRKVHTHVGRKWLQEFGRHWKTISVVVSLPSNRRVGVFAFPSRGGLIDLEEFVQGRGRICLNRCALARFPWGTKRKMFKTYGCVFFARWVFKGH